MVDGSMMFPEMKLKFNRIMCVENDGKNMVIMMAIVEIFKKRLITSALKKILGDKAHAGWWICNRSLIIYIKDQDIELIRSCSKMQALTGILWFMVLLLSPEEFENQNSDHLFS